MKGPDTMQQNFIRSKNEKYEKKKSSNTCISLTKSTLYLVSYLLPIIKIKIYNISLAE